MAEPEVLAVQLPRWGLTTEDAVVVEWMVAVGDRVEEGAPLLTVETDKTTAEVEAPAAGRLLRVLARAGATVQPGDVLAEIEVGT